MHGNRVLPSWLESDTKNSIMHIFGTPEEEDVGELLIRISGDGDVLHREFRIVVVPPKSNLEGSMQLSPIMY
jgi:hypothetical protein